MLGIIRATKKVKGVGKKERKNRGVPAFVTAVTTVLAEVATREKMQRRENRGERKLEVMGLNLVPAHSEERHAGFYGRRVR